jgi:hypothetical protein
MTGTQKIEKVESKDGPVEKPKKLPAAFPDNFDTEQKDNSGDTRPRKGAKLHGSM